jgi:lysyl-tRNA synthetase class 2
VAYLIGAVDVASGLRHTVHDRLRTLPQVVPGVVGDAASAATIVTGILLVLIAHGLRRRKARAWRTTVALLAVSVVLHGVRLHGAAVLVALVVLVVLVLERREFHAVGDPTTRWRSLTVFLGLLATSTGLGVLVLAADRHDIVGGWPGIWPVLQQVWWGLIGVDGDLVLRGERLDEVVSALLLGLGLMTGLTSLYLLLRAPEPHAEMTDADEARLRELLRSSSDSLGYFNLRPDKSVVWSGTRKAAVAYRVVGGVMLASGDPVGDAEAWPGAMAAFLREAQEHAWTPAVLGCSERAGLAWTRVAGLSAMELGDEAVLEVADFSLQGRSMRNVRQMVARIRRAGYGTRVCRVADLSPGERHAVLEDAAGWRRSETERGFSMALGRTADVLDPEAVLVTAVLDGRVRGLLQLVPWGEDGMSLDLMRRDSTAEPGVNELLISAAMEAAPGLGVSRVSLNFAVFRAVLERGERLGAGPLLRTWRTLLVFASRWFQIESLYRFTAKFQPQWQPRYLLYPGAADLPRVGVAALEAEALFVRPSWRRIREGRP